MAVVVVVVAVVSQPASHPERIVKSERGNSIELGAHCKQDRRL